MSTAEIRAQYARPGNLLARAALHQRYGTAVEPFFPWVRAGLPLGQGERVLEVGAGTGALWRQTGLPVDVDLVLSDTSSGMRAELAELAPGRVLGVSAERIPCPTDILDGALAHHCLYHLPDPEVGVRELARVVRPGGWVSLLTNAADNLAPLFALADRAGLAPPAAVTANAFSDQVADELGRRHLVDVEVRAYDDPLVVPDARPLVDYVLSAHTEEPSAEQLTALEREVAAALADGPLVLPKRVVHVVGRVPLTGGS
ncbi:MAG TPA: methyltransferase domain-containing protein [Motilibacteraceae bacterium]|nr:methyltransferase domain-containing protein [Motilibacteraceae bacterium]